MRWSTHTLVQNSSSIHMFTKTDGKKIAKVDKDLHCFYPIAKQQGLQKRCEPVVKLWSKVMVVVVVGPFGACMTPSKKKKNCNDAVPNISFNLKSHHDQQLTSIWASFFGMLCHRRWFFPITFIRVFLYKKPHNIGETVPIIKTPQKNGKKNGWTLRIFPALFRKLNSFNSFQGASGQHG